jgi:putative hydroxymethylpyrimidine transport system substrate-binding protein
MNLRPHEADRVFRAAKRGGGVRVGVPRGVAGALGLAAVAIAVAGCGEVTNTIKPNPGTANHITVELAGPPDAYDVGMYAAQALGYFKQTDMIVTFQTPSAGQDPLTMLHEGKVPIAISSEPSVFLARNQEMPVVAVAALVQKPLSQIPITLPPKHLPSGGNGITTTTGVPVTGPTGTNTSTTQTSTGTTTTGTTTTGTTTTGTSTATTPTTTTPTPAQVPTGSVWPAQLQALLAQSNAPTYNGLVVVVRKGTIVDHAPVIRRFVQAVERGYEAVRRHPRQAVADLIAADPGLASERRELMATVRATLPYFFLPGTIWGWQKESEWNFFGTWLDTNKLINNTNAITDASTNELLQGEGV